MPITYLDEPIQKKSTITYLDDPSVESLISSRKSSIDVNNPINPINLTPFGGSKMIPESMRALSGGMEIAEGVPADIGLGLQNAVKTGGKSVLNIPSDIFKTLRGERPAQFGDIYRGAGAPEPLAEVGGLLASASKYTPSGAMGEKIAEGIGSAVKPAVKPIGNFIKSGTAKIMSGLSGVPEKSVRLALDNPEVLSKKAVSRQISAAGQEMEKNVKPLINDPNAIIKTTPEITSLGKKLNLYTPSGAKTKVLSAMQTNEEKMVTDWLNRADNGRGGIDFNEADKIVGEIDSELQGYYKALKKGEIYKNTQFDRVAKAIRNAVNDARKTQFPQAGSSIDSYSRALAADTANKAFQKPFPSSYVIPKMGAEAAIAFLNPQLGGALATAASPFMQGMAIRGASTVGRIGRQSLNPAVMAQILRRVQSR